MKSSKNDTNTRTRAVDYGLTHMQKIEYKGKYLIKVEEKSLPIIGNHAAKIIFHDFYDEKNSTPITFVPNSSFYVLGPRHTFSPTDVTTVGTRAYNSVMHSPHSDLIFPYAPMTFVAHAKDDLENLVPYLNNALMNPILTWAIEKKIRYLYDIYCKATYHPMAHSLALDTSTIIVRGVITEDGFSTKFEDWFVERKIEKINSILLD